MSRRAGRARAEVAAALAGAFLAGEWEPAAMARRARRAMGVRHAWVGHLAQAVHAGYGRPPLDRPRELARFVAACEPFERAWSHAHPTRRLRVRTWLAVPTEMGPTRWPVPPLPDLAALAAWLGVDAGHLAWFADARGLERRAPDERLRHYRRRWVRKRDGSLRLLEAPKRELKDLQRQVLHDVLDRVPPHPAAHGFRPAGSVRSAAAPHAGRAVVLRFDLEAFFASVTAGRVYGIFRLAGYPEPVAHALAALCTTAAPVDVLAAAPAVGPAQIEGRRRLLRRLAAPHLAQGAPTSPALANLSAYRLDRRLAGLGRQMGATYTRYADDMALSGGRDLARSGGSVARLVAAIAAEEGFRLHPGKTRLATAAQRQTVAGLVVNRRPQVRRADYDRLRAVLHDAARSGPEAANRAGHPDFRSHLLGRISWVATGNPTRAAKLARAFAAIQW